MDELTLTLHAKDIELRVIEGAVLLLTGLPPEEQDRIVGYLSSRYGIVR